MKSLAEIKKILSTHKDEFYKKYGVVILGVFGSYARNEQTQDSDVDILVDLERPLGFEFFKLWDELEEILDVKVDLLTVNSVRRKKTLWESIKEDLTGV